MSTPVAVDHEGSNLHVVHVLPYRILSEEYGDYAYQKEHSVGELTAGSLPELAQALSELAVKHILAWAEGSDDGWGRRYLPEIGRLNRFRYGLDRYGCYTDLSGKIARAPENSLTFVEIGSYRVELRLEHGAAPSLPEDQYGFQMVLPAMEAALTVARQRLEENLAKRDEAAQAAARAHKQAELARLKAELGEE